MPRFWLMRRRCSMANKTHAVLGASSSHRWLHCTPSARLEQEFENTESTAAAEGTAAHALAEHKLKRMLKRRSKRPVSTFDCDEMEDCTDAYVQFVMEQLAEVKKSCRNWIFQRMYRMLSAQGTASLWAMAYCISSTSNMDRGCWSRPMRILS